MQARAAEPPPARQPQLPVNDSTGESSFAGRLSYTRDIQPILASYCFNCHGLDEHARQAGLRLDVRELALAALDSGARAIVPGKVAASELLTRITSADSGTVMPPALVQKAARAAADSIAPAEGRPRGRARNALGMPAGAASRDSRRRRPPCRLAPKSDRPLRARPARPGKTAARYADTDGYNNDGERTQWPWRDWVIDAFARNMPYDRFVVEQFAGDLLPDASREQRIATGFGRNHVLLLPRACCS